MKWKRSRDSAPFLLRAKFPMNCALRLQLSLDCRLYACLLSLNRNNPSFTGLYVLRRQSLLRSPDGLPAKETVEMKNLLRAALLSSMLLIGAHHAAAQVAIGIQIGPPPPPRHYVVPVSPGPEFVWVEGYWYPVNSHYVWHRGYWTRPPYAGAHWIGPRHEGGHFYGGYWDGPHGRFEHNHHWDGDHDRDHDRWRH